MRNKALLNQIGRYYSLKHGSHFDSTQSIYASLTLTCVLLKD